jgi:hypothetical protein
MQRNSVVFPQPEGPTRTMNSPSSIVRSTPSTARVPFGNVFTTSWSSISATRYPFNPVVTIPRVSCFCKTKKARIAGKAKSSAPASVTGSSWICCASS